MSANRGFTMTMSTFSQSCIVLAVHLVITVSGELCAHGHSCPASQRCCEDTCCLPDHYNTDRHHYHGFGFRWSIWNMWYFWFILIFILMSCFGGCGYWRRRQLLLAQHQQHMMGHYDNYHTSGNRVTYNGPHLTMPVFAAGYDPSIFVGGGGAAVHTRNIGDFGANPQTQQFFPSPPPYSEVVAKPEVWPPSKDELPPYPGEPIVSANQGEAMPQNAVGEEPFATGTAAVPGLPPYSPVNPASSDNTPCITTEYMTVSSLGDSGAAAATATDSSSNQTMDISTVPPISNSAYSSAGHQRSAAPGQDAPQCVPDVHA